MADITKLELVAAMLGRDLQTVRREGQTSFHGEGHAADRTLVAAEHLRVGAKVQGREPLASAPARSSASPACSAPAAPRRRAPSSAPTAPDAGTITRRRQAGLVPRADRRDRARPRLLLRGPQDRGHRARDVGARESDARAAAAPCPLGHRRRGQAARDRRALHQAPRHQDVRPRAEDPRALRRQPAEGAARPLAVHEPAASHPRRADARHRRRRQGRDPGADPRARRRRASAC